jgi:hypothetical protein
MNIANGLEIWRESRHGASQSVDWRAHSKSEGKSMIRNVFRHEPPTTEKMEKNFVFGKLTTEVWFKVISWFINCTVEMISLLHSDWSIFLPRDFAAREITGGLSTKMRGTCFYVDF